ncbi:MAG TPA: radical SAM protein, partial [Planctomycetota bacterium]|nr:radical SAM protein [Planctomycetota bacterium]
MRGPEIEGRPGRKRGQRHLFRPNYLSFSGTYACNLSCAHCCVPIEWEDRLEIGAAVRFLESAHEAGIRILGFTGGEPFIYPEFVVALARRAVELGGWTFDKVMSNGTWYEDEKHLRKVLRDLKKTGYSGRIGLSVDKFHPVRTERLALFCEVTAEVFRRDDIISINSASASREKGLERVEALAKALSGTIGYSELLGGHMLVTDRLSATLHWNHLAPVERAEFLGGGFDGTWFKEDYCEGPGQALIVTPKGEVKPCCGFASDLDQLTIAS